MNCSPRPSTIWELYLLTGQSAGWQVRLRPFMIHPLFPGESVKQHSDLINSQMTILFGAGVVDVYKHVTYFAHFD
ncbi:hypothetical protein Hypma_008491 [Hypsizygus marmoreus]|uniref:Uncharacterized protein n=1 Tax=Hypsizygus marmoreus TaxID=39966 RepID=A0A369JQ72_HYPMA|nr:hypothetical protein Hypma_008491 [Hypsizygus marmoreus]